MKRILFSLVLVTLVLSVVLVGYMAEEKLVWNENWPTKIRIGSASPGGGFYMVASCLANVLNKEFPQLEVIVEQTKASVHNVKLIEAKEIEFGITTSDTHFEAWIGQGPFEGVPHKGARIMMTSGPTPVMFVSLMKRGITSIKDVSGTVSVKTKGSAGDAYTRKIIETFDLKNVKTVYITPVDGVEALKNGIIDGYLMGHPNAITQELSMQADIRILGMTEEEGNKFLKEHPEYLFPLTISGGVYKGLDEPIDSFGFYTVYIVREDLPEDMVYTVVKAMYKHQDIIEATWPTTAKGMVPESLKLLSSPLHKGSIKYFREVGAEIPARVILDE